MVLATRVARPADSVVEMTATTSPATIHTAQDKAA